MNARLVFPAVLILFICTCTCICTTCTCICTNVSEVNRFDICSWRRWQEDFVRSRHSARIQSVHEVDCCLMNFRTFYLPNLDIMYLCQRNVCLKLMFCRLVFVYVSVRRSNCTLWSKSRTFLRDFYHFSLKFIEVTWFWGVVANVCTVSKCLLDDGEQV